MAALQFPVTIIGGGMVLSAVPRGELGLSLQREHGLRAENGHVIPSVSRGRRFVDFHIVDGCAIVGESRAARIWNWRCTSPPDSEICLQDPALANLKTI